MTETLASILAHYIEEGTHFVSFVLAKRKQEKMDSGHLQYLINVLAGLVWKLIISAFCQLFVKFLVNSVALTKLYFPRDSFRYSAAFSTKFSNRNWTCVPEKINPEFCVWKVQHVLPESQSSRLWLFVRFPTQQLTPEIFIFQDI